MKDLGPELPRNWYLLGSSSGLRRGQIVSHDIAGRSVIIYRGRDSGGAVAFDAHCAHMGCHLGRGEVLRDKLRCGLHHRLIAPDGAFAGPAETRLQQRAYRVREVMDGLFVHLGETPEETPFAAPELAGYANCYAGEHHFPLSWQALVANGLDIEHLASVHERALLQPPRIELLSAREIRLRYRTRPTGRGLSDRVTAWLAKDGVHGTIRSLSGTSMLVESRLGARETFILMSFCPDSAGGTIIRGLVGVKGPMTLKNRLSSRIARALFKAFLYKDLHVLEGLKWHEPDESAAIGDRATREVCAFFRSLPSA